MSEPFKVITSVQGVSTKFEVLQYGPLQKADYYYEQTSGARLNQVRILLDDGEIITEAGALHFSKGNIIAQNSTGGASGLMKKLTGSVLTKESTFKPSYQGSGELYLEPGFRHFLIHSLDHEEIIVDKDMFLCCESTVKVGVAVQKTLSSAFQGGEGLFQTQLSGHGLCALQSPVPAHEILKVHLNNERLQVDGNFAILRSANIQFTVERSAKGIIGSFTSGEGLLQTFTGTGTVWLAPTIRYYQTLHTRQS